MSVEILLEKITKAIAFQYATDKTAPGLTVANLKNGDFYCSIVRYSGAFAKDKKVVCSARGTDLSVALEGVAREFLTAINIPVDPVHDLDSFVRKAV